MTRNKNQTRKFSAIPDQVVMSGEAEIRTLKTKMQNIDNFNIIGHESSFSKIHFFLRNKLHIDWMSLPTQSRDSLFQTGSMFF